MQPLNPFLAAFFKSSIATQCTPVQHHVLLVPLTDVLLTWRDTDSGAVANEAVASEDFLGSHVLRIPPPPHASSGGKDGAHNLREVRGKAKQFSTLNGRSVVIKDSVVYSNKGIYYGDMPLLLRHKTIMRLFRAYTNFSLWLQASKLFPKHSC